MASNGNPVLIPAISLVHGSQAPTTIAIQPTSGKILPPSGNAAAAAAADPTPPAAKSVQAQVALLNNHLNNSGRPDQFQVDPSSGPPMIQEINPATGEVIAKYPVSEFPALARS